MPQSTKTWTDGLIMHSTPTTQGFLSLKLSPKGSSIAKYNWVLSDYHAIICAIKDFHTHKALAAKWNKGKKAQQHYRRLE